MRTSENDQRPNIIFIMSDDQGIWSLGSYGNDEIKTPNLDLLAKRGIRFNEFYCTSPVCSPARASLLTGKIPSQHGIHDWIREGNIEKPVEYLEGEVAYTDILADNGYICGISGKWHLGDSLKPQKSFSHWYVHQRGGGPYYNAPMVKNGECIEEKEYLTKAITDDALQFLEKYSKYEDPFYLSIHYTAPHDPWINNHPEEYIKLYNDCEFNSCPQNDLQPWFKPTMNINDNNWRENAKGYYASITAMDEQIGRVLDFLEKNNLTKKTLIVFTSDNGFSCGHHGFWGKGNGTIPLNMYDYSIKVPFIMTHVGQIPEGRTCDALLSGYDFMPTLLEYAGLNYNLHSQKMPGRSFYNLLFDENDKLEDQHVVVYDEYGPVRMIRTREWKYIHRFSNGPHELYNLIEDPTERVNLVDSVTHESILKELKNELFEWFQKYSDEIVDGSRLDVRGFGQIDVVKGPPSRNRSFKSLQ